MNAPKYGNDDAYADAIGRDIEDTFCRLTRRYPSALAFGDERAGRWWKKHFVDPRPLLETKGLV